MAALTTINQAGAAVGDTFNGRPIIAIQADGTYVYGEATDDASPSGVESGAISSDYTSGTSPAYVNSGTGYRVPDTPFAVAINPRLLVVTGTIHQGLSIGTESVARGYSGGFVQVLAPDGTVIATQSFPTEPHTAGTAVNGARVPLTFDLVVQDSAQLTPGTYKLRWTNLTVAGGGWRVSNAGEVRAQFTAYSAIDASPQVVEATPTKLKYSTGRLKQEGVATFSGSGSGSVTFPEAFKAGTTPVVSGTPMRAGLNLSVTIQTVTETGFTYWLVGNENAVGTAGDVHWTAVGEAS